MSLYLSWPISVTATIFDLLEMHFAKGLPAVFIFDPGSMHVLGLLHGLQRLIAYHSTHRLSLWRPSRSVGWRQSYAVRVFYNITEHRVKHKPPGPPSLIQNPCNAFSGNSIHRLHTCRLLTANGRSWTHRRIAVEWRRFSVHGNRRR